MQSKLSTLLLALCLAAAAVPALSQQLSAEDFARIRCSLDGKSVCVRPRRRTWMQRKIRNISCRFYTWTGSVFSFQPQQQQQQLFDFVGYNVARCVKDAKVNPSARFV